VIKRSLVVVKAKPPFLEWLRSLPDPARDDVTLGDVHDDSSVYLLPEWDDDKDRERLLRRHYARIFERELEGWWRLEDDWPKKRTLAVFEQWFEVEFHSMLVDLARGPLEDDER
jgi:hypothetical protein